MKRLSRSKVVSARISQPLKVELLVWRLKTVAALRRRSTRTDALSVLIYLDATKFVLLRVFTLTETICPAKIWAKPRPKNAKSPLPCVARKRPCIVRLYRLLFPTNETMIVSTPQLLASWETRNVAFCVYSINSYERASTKRRITTPKWNQAIVTAERGRFAGTTLQH